MCISRVRSPGKDGKGYVSVLLRQSKRIGKKVVSKTIAVLTDMPSWLIHVVERAVLQGKDADTLQQLATDPASPLALRSGQSFGAAFLVHVIAKSAHIVQALGSTTEAELALWQVLARKPSSQPPTPTSKSTPKPKSAPGSSAANSTRG